MSQSLSSAEVKKIARLARLTLAEAEIEEYRDKLGSVIGYMERLRRIDVAGVEPLTNIADSSNKLREDAPGPVLANAALMKMAPESMPPFVRVPKVLGEGSSA